MIQALLAGEQIVELRRVAGGGPPPGTTRFWLRPGPGPDPALKPAYQRAHELSLPDEGPGPDKVRIDGWAELAGSAGTVVDDKVRTALDGKTILALDPFVGDEVLVLALRAHRLAEPVTVTEDLTGLPADPAEGPPSGPALSDTAFGARYKGVDGSLPGGLTRPG